MNLIVLLIAAYLPLLPVLFLTLRSGAFGKGSRGVFLKLFFLGIAAAVPAFLMEAGGMMAVSVLLRLFPENSFGGKLPLAAAVLRYVAAGALIEEAWKFFVLRVSTWKHMTMEAVGDGIAASAVVGAGFSAVLYGAWQAAFLVVPADMEALHGAMPAFLNAGAVVSFLYALLFVFAHFGFSGFMGAMYGAAKRSEQRNHGGRAGFMLFLSFLLPILVHGLCAAVTGYGITEGKLLWTFLGLAGQTVLAMIMCGALVSASDDAREAAAAANAAPQPEAPVDFADTEEFAEFAESSGTPALEYNSDAEPFGSADVQAQDMEVAETPDAQAQDMEVAETPDAQAQDMEMAETPDAQAQDMEMAGTPDARAQDMEVAGTPNDQAKDGEDSGTWSSWPQNAEAAGFTDPAESDEEPSADSGDSSFTVTGTASEGPWGSGSSAGISEETPSDQQGQDIQQS